MVTADQQAVCCSLRLTPRLSLELGVGSGLAQYLLVHPQGGYYDKSMTLGTLLYTAHCQACQGALRPLVYL